MPGGAIMLRAARGLGRTRSGRKAGGRGQLQKWDSRTSVMSHASVAMGPLPAGSRRSVFDKDGGEAKGKEPSLMRKGTGYSSFRGAPSASPAMGQTSRRGLTGGSRLDAVEKSPQAKLLAAMSPSQRDVARGHKVAIIMAQRCAMAMLAGLSHDQVARVASMGD